jgi:hypothetical protein
MQFGNIVLGERNNLETHDSFGELFGSPLKRTTYRLLTLQWKIIHFYEEK